MAPVNVLMVGTGEYTTGWVGTGGSGSDKKVSITDLGITLRILVLTPFRSASSALLSLTCAGAARLANSAWLA